MGKQLLKTWVRSTLKTPLPLSMLGLYTATTPKPAQWLGDHTRCFPPAGLSQLLSGEGQIQGWRKYQARNSLLLLHLAPAMWVRDLLVPPVRAGHPPCYLSCAGWAKGPQGSLQHTHRRAAAHQDKSKHASHRHAHSWLGNSRSVHFKSSWTWSPKHSTPLPMGLGHVPPSVKQPNLPTDKVYVICHRQTPRFRKQATSKPSYSRIPGPDEERRCCNEKPFQYPSAWHGCLRCLISTLQNAPTIVLTGNSNQDLNSLLYSTEIMQKQNTWCILT